MANRGFKMGATGKVVVVVPGDGDEAGVTPAIGTIVDGDGAVADVAHGSVDTSSVEPDVMHIEPYLRADDDGMNGMHAVGIAIEGEAAAVFSVIADVVIESVPPSPFAVLIASHRPVVADCFVRVQLPPMLPAVARAMAQRIADLTGASVDVHGPDVITAIAPRAVSRGTVGRGTGTKTAAEPRAAKIERDWSTYDARTEGGKYSNPKLWQAIKDAADAGDLDMLLAYDFAGSHDTERGNTQQQNLGRFLRAWIAILQDRIAARASLVDAYAAEMGLIAAA